MAQTDVLLLQPIEGLGHEGETVKVKLGYARNFLLPRKLASPATLATKRQTEALQRRRAARLAHELDEAKKLAEKLAAVRVALAVKTGPGGKLFGAISATDLINRLGEEKVFVHKRAVNFEAPVKTLGKHVAHLKLHPEVHLDFEFEVVSENPIEETVVEAPPAPVEGRRERSYDRPPREDRPARDDKRADKRDDKRRDRK